MRFNARTAAVRLGLLLTILSPAPAAATDEVIVAYEKDSSRDERVDARAAAGVADKLMPLELAGAKLVRVVGGSRAAVAQLERQPGVSYAERNSRVTVAGPGPRPNDPGFTGTYALNNRGQGGGLRDADIDAPEGWKAAGLAGFPLAGGPRIAVIDTGIDRTHPDLRGRVVQCAQSRPPLLFAPRFVEGSCSDDNGHGTHVSGIIAANANNSEGIAGVAFNAKLMICRALGGIAGDGTLADVVACIDWAARNGAEVINLSLEAGFSPTLERSVQQAWRGGDGALLLAAAGNRGSSVRFPAGSSAVVSVGATDRSDRRANFSNANSDVELSAPGADILSTRLGGGYVLSEGTSQAAPQAAGVAGLLLSARPKLNGEDTRRILRRSSDDLGQRGRDSAFGAGRVNLCNALRGDCSYAPDRKRDKRRR